MAHPARAPPNIEKNMIFWRKIVIFHTKYPKNVRASLRSAQILDPPLRTYYGMLSRDTTVLDSNVVCVET